MSAPSTNPDVGNIKVPNSPRTPRSASITDGRGSRAFSLIRRRDGSPVASQGTTLPPSWEFLGSGQGAAAPADTSIKNKTRSLIAKVEAVRGEPSTTPGRRMSTRSVPRSRVISDHASTVRADDDQFQTPVAISGIPNAQGSQASGAYRNGMFVTPTSRDRANGSVNLDKTSLPGSYWTTACKRG